MAGFQKRNQFFGFDVSVSELKSKQSNPLQEPTILQLCSKSWDLLLETVMDGFLSKRCTGKGTTNLTAGVIVFQDSMRCGFCNDKLWCFWTKSGSEMRAFHDLLTHLSRTMFLTLSRNRISETSSLGTNKACKGGVSITVTELKSKNPNTTKIEIAARVFTTCNAALYIT